MSEFLSEYWLELFMGFSLICFIFINLKSKKIIPVVEQMTYKNIDGMDSSRTATSDLKQKNTDDPTSEIIFLNLTEECSLEELQTSLSTYFGALEGIIKQATHEIVALDCIGHCDSMSSSADWSAELKRFYTLYFTRIQEFLTKNSHVKYRRILMLPPLPSIYRQDAVWNSLEDDEQNDYLQRLLYEPTFHHIKKMFELNKQGIQRFELYLLKDPVRSISELIVDDKFWITEIDRHTTHGVSIPDRLFIHKSSKSTDIEKILREKTFIDQKIEGFVAITSMAQLDYILPGVLARRKSIDQETA